MAMTPFRLYILEDDGTTRPCSTQEWVKFFDSGKKKLWRTRLSDGTMVSTIFLGIDHSLSFEGGPPILFETMVFQAWDRPTPDEGMGPIDQRRYATKAEAERGHNEAITYWEGKLAETAERIGELVNKKVKVEPDGS